jgi:hypothetical protein
MARLRAWVVLRLMTSSNVVGCSMGRSPGGAPCRKPVSHAGGSVRIPTRYNQVRDEVMGDAGGAFDPK